MFHALPSVTGSRYGSLLLVCILCLMGMGLMLASSALAAFPGGNGRIAFMSDRDLEGDLNVWTMNPDGTGQMNLTPDSPREDAYPTWSPDGRRITFQSERVTPTNRTGDFEIFVMNADGSGLQQLTSNTYDDEEPSWSPSGRWIVFGRDFDRVRGKLDLDIMTMRATGGRERNLTKSPKVDDLQARWSPDGRRIAFTSERDGDYEIYTMNPRGSRVRQLTRNKENEEGPNWSPDGRRIAFNSNRDDKYEIYTMRANGTDPKRLTITTGESGNSEPAWSPDGRMIAFSSNRGPAGTPDIWTMGAQGNDPVVRANSLGVDYSADWQPLQGSDGSGDD